VGRMYWRNLAAVALAAALHSFCGAC
jgi:hypothetical protein